MIHYDQKLGSLSVDYPPDVRNDYVFSMGNSTRPPKKKYPDVKLHVDNFEDDPGVCRLESGSRPISIRVGVASGEAEC